MFILIGVEELEKQHLETYKNAILELIRNNTDTLITEDIISLLKQPPLDSMDSIRNKLFNLSKQFEVILDKEAVDNLLSQYRGQLVETFSSIGGERVQKLNKLVQDFSPNKPSDMIKIPKKEFTSINSKMKKDSKEKIKSTNQMLLVGLPTLFKKDTDDSHKREVIKAMEKYLTGSYSKDLIESMELKIVIKDTTLMNSILEQGERYLFTKTNSHLFDVSINRDSI